MGFIRKLQKYVLSSILCDWLLVRELCELDSAICNTIERVRFSSYLSFLCLARDNDDISANQKFIDWIESKLIILQKLSFDGFYPIISKRLLVQLTGLCLLNINITRINISQFINDIVRCKQLTELHLSEFDANGFDSHTWLTLANNNPNMKKLTLFRVKCLSEHLIQCSRSWRGLLHVDLSCCYDLTNDSLCALVANCINLQTLKLKYCKYVSDSAVQLIAHHCPELTSLTLCGTSITYSALLELIARCTELSDLRVSTLYHLESTVALCTAIAQTLPRITVLDISGIMNMSDECISLLCGQCTTLTDLSIACTLISLTSFVKIRDSLVNLRNISFYQSDEDLTIRALLLLSDLFQYIYELDLSYHTCTLTGLPRSAYKGVCKSKYMSSFGTKLIENGEIAVSYALITTILPKCRAQLTHFSAHSKMSDDTLCDLSVGFTELTYLHLHWVWNTVTDRVLLAVAQYCRKLTYLNIDNCYSLTAESVLLVAKNNRKLKTLSASSMGSLLLPNIKREIELLCPKIHIIL